MRAVTVTVGTILIAGHYSIGTAPEFGSSTSARILWVIRVRQATMAAPGIGRRMLALGWIQPEHVQQNGGNVCHHDEWNEHDEPR